MTVEWIKSQDWARSNRRDWNSSKSNKQSKIHKSNLSKSKSKQQTKNPNHSQTNRKNPQNPNNPNHHNHNSNNCNKTTVTLTLTSSFRMTSKLKGSMWLFWLPRYVNSIITRWRPFCWGMARFWAWLRVRLRGKCLRKGTRAMSLWRKMTRRARIRNKKRKNKREINRKNRTISSMRTV